MSIENVKSFYEALSQDELLRQKITELSQKHQGAAMDEAQAAWIFAQEVLPLAAKQGLSFTMEELRQYGTELRQTNNGHELGDAELVAVTGGCDSLQCFALGQNLGDYNGFCFLLGFNNTGGFCLLFGYTLP